MNKVLLFTLTYLLGFFTTIFSQNAQQGFALYKNLFFDTVKNEYTGSKFLPDSKIWFNKKYSIREAVAIVWHESNSITTKFEVPIIGYYFIDIHAKRLYEYPKFSQNVKFSSNYLAVDSIKKSVFGNFFWKAQDPSQELKLAATTYSKLSDTIINKTLFKREISKTDSNGYRKILYYRYDIEKSNIHYDLSFDANNILPVVMIEFLFPNSKMKQLLEISYERLYLTRKEKKVFKAWIKNAKKVEKEEKKKLER
ncbi:MAG: hypothetical protein KBF36_07875 [Chitinophagaceae bacterium]|jgi:hypothetical protein|nr:hypothetical protein [Chitinophagaceae bacterium]MBP9740983.1 hypothetical protein [Chitinophagaceae bacterium]